MNRRRESDERASALALGDRLQPVDGDPIACERIVTNLLYNALKFTPPTGRIVLTSSAERDEVVVTVTDTGPGIPPAQMPHLFERFQGASPGRHEGGLGLGLFIVRTLTEAQGGRVEVASTLGAGTTFRIVLRARR